LFAHLREQTVRHAAQRGLDVLLIGQIAAECFLMTESLLRLARGNEWSLINSVSKLPNQRSLISQHQLEHFQRRSGDMADLREPSGIQPHARLWSNTRQPLIWKRMQKLSLSSRMHFVERGRLRQL